MTTPLFIQPDWPAPKNIKAYTTTRAQGASQAPYTEFNLAHHVGDDAKAVAQNRQQLQQRLKLPSEPVWLNQTHSTRAICIDQAPNSTTGPVNTDADASFTSQNNRICSVLTADCLPILLCNQNGSEVAAIHAGWKGLLNGIINSTLASLQSPAHTLLAWLGPAIGPSAFEVSDDFRVAFLARNPQNSPCFMPKQNKWLADIYQLARINLQQAGVKYLFGGNLCTVTQQDYFYSYRRDNVTGRMASLIWLT